MFDRVKNCFFLFVCRSTREIVRLTGQNYNQLVVDAQPRNMTLVLLVEENTKEYLLRDFKLMISPTERSLYSVL